MIRHTLLIIAYSILTASVLSGCSQDQVPMTEPDPRPIVLGYDYDVELFTMDKSTQSSTGNSRTSGINTSATPTVPTTAGVFGAMEGYDHAIFDNQKFYHIDDKPYFDEFVAAGHDWSKISNDWPYDPIVMWSIGSKYNFYCYSPHSDYDNTTVEMAYIQYGGMQKFTHSKIPPFSNVAYTVSKTVDKTDTTDDSSFTGVVPFAMKHLSARICLCMKIGQKYHRLRDIRIKEVTINDRGTDDDYYKWEVDLSQTPATYTLSTDGKYAPSSTNPVVNIIPIFDDEDGLELEDSEFQQFGSLYVVPQRVGTLRMNVKYDVYDKDGLLLRQDQSISNDVEYHKDVKEGYYYNINIVVSPAYLYVLSDNDVAPDLVLDVNL